MNISNLLSKVTLGKYKSRKIKLREASKGYLNNYKERKIRI
jgi:hypothetical protein